MTLTLGFWSREVVFTMCAAAMIGCPDTFYQRIRS